MQVSPLETVLQAALTTSTATAARVVAGNLTALPIGSLLKATVTSVTPRDATLTVNGQQLTVRPPPAGVQPGAVFLVRVPPGAANSTNPTLELNVPPNPAQTQQAAEAAGTPGARVATSLPTASGTPGAPVATPLPTASGNAASSAAAQTARSTSTNPLTSTLSRPSSASLAVTASTTPRPTLVDVLSSLPNGQVRVAIDGQEQVATSSQPLVSGQRYVLQVQQTPTGIVLNPPQESPQLATDVAAAILRTPAPTLGTAIQSLQSELTTLTTPPAGGTSTSVPTAVSDAATVVKNVLSTIIPSEPRPLNSAELQQLVENGGQQFEAKLARLVAPQPQPPAPTQTQPPAQSQSAATPTTTTETASSTDAKATSATQTSDAVKSDVGNPPPTTPRSPQELAPDLKGSLLSLLQTVQDLGGTAAPAAQAALNGIEAQQAANTLAQANNTPYFLQVPFPDGGVWRTMQISLEPQSQPNQPETEQAGRFRLFMHVPLTDLGETWIDAGVAGNQFRATIYLDQPTVRDRVRASLPELRSELQSGGFSEVLLNVRATSELPSRYRSEANALKAGRPDTVSVLDVRV